MSALLEWQFTGLALPQAVAAILALAGGLFVWRHRRGQPLGFWLALMLASNALWAGAGALEFLAATVPAKILLSQISYLGIVAGPVILLHFTHAYLDPGARPPRPLLVAAYTLGAGILLAAWTNSSHLLLWTDVVPQRDDGLLFVRYERGPFFWLTVAFCYGVMLRCSVLLLGQTIRIGGVFGRQGVLIVLATLAPWIASAAYVLRLGPRPELDHTPVGFAATGLLLSLGVLRFRLFELAPIPADTLFARIPDPVLVTDHAGHLVRANTAAFERFRLTRSDLGEPVAAVLRAHPALVALLHDRPDLRWKHTLPDGDAWWAVESGPVHPRATRSGARLLLLRDITEQKRSELLLADALARAEDLRREADAANAAKSTFLAQISHDLRTPLHAILGVTDLMLSGPLDEQLRADARTVREAGGILLRLINDLLDLSRIEAGRVDLAHEPFRLDELATPVIDLLAVKARAKNLALAATLDPTLPVALCGDADRLRQILFNLAGNAVKFTASGSVSIDLELERSAANAHTGLLCISVTDTGPGIPADRLANLFEPFDRGDPDSVRRIEGTGLGLAICRRLAEAMGGGISVSSEPGRGSVFRLRLPILDAHAPPDTPGLRSLPAVLDRLKPDRAGLARL